MSEPNDDARRLAEAQAKAVEIEAQFERRDWQHRVYGVHTHPSWHREDDYWRSGTDPAPAFTYMRTLEAQLTAAHAREAALVKERDEARQEAQDYVTEVINKVRSAIGSLGPLNPSHHQVVTVVRKALSRNRNLHDQRAATPEAS